MIGLYTFVLMLSAISNTSPVYEDTALLRKKVVAELATQPTGVYAVAFKDLSSGETFFINEHASFHAASTMKTPVMIETYRQVAKHKFALTDSIVVKNTFLSIADGTSYSLDSVEDSEHDLYTRIGTRLPVSDILFRMITKSSNLGTNIIIDKVGAENVMKTMRRMGAKEIRILRGVEDDKAFGLGMNNTTTAYDLMLIMEKIAKGKAVNKKSSDEMIDILMHQHFTDVIRGKLPEGVKVASKSGSIPGICHDSGIVFLPDGRKYVIVLLSKGVMDADSGKQTLAAVSKIIYDHVVNR